MALDVRHLWVALALILPPYWPGAPGTPTDADPTYDRRIPVVDTIGVQDAKAVREWNSCSAGVQLVRGVQALAEQTDTITILPGIDELPRGGWTGDHGVLLLPGGAWERSVPVIRHELGHALGFGHTNLWSIMGGSSHVQPRDCRGLRSYYD